MRSIARIAAFALLLTACSTPPSTAPETSVKPGINQDYLADDLDVARFENRFEVESREVFTQRAKILAACGLRTGMHVADIGAGTGLFTLLMASRLGESGKVYAVDIAPKFVEHIEQRAAERKLGNIRGVVCGERDVNLPAASIDLAFVCDTYHHFEYPMSTLATIHAALRPGGELVIVDFIREPGQSRQWILDHVRAGRDVVRQEIEAAGFTFVRQEPTPFLQENYLLRFVRS
ncbi:MAG: methyltransferase domain-containing protein [Planctomycetes bacterium]|nr:methyltransferase domain-containing protein [Planctomycetota bacterium]